MTPKEKAKELIDTYRYALSIPNSPLGDYKDNIAKQCALIAVDEMLNLVCAMDGKDLWQKYYEQVKKEIKKL